MTYVKRFGRLHFEPKTRVYSVPHQLEEHEPVEEIASLIEDIKENAPKLGKEKPRIGVELTEKELADVLSHEKFGRLQKLLQSRDESHRTDYFRFWHAIAHGLGGFELVPIDHEKQKKMQDEAIARAFQRGDPEPFENEEVVAHFNGRGGHMGERLLNEKFYAAIVGYRHTFMESEFYKKLRSKIARFSFVEF